MSDLDVHTVPAGAFAAAWLNVSRAASDDEGWPLLYRTVCLDLFDPIDGPVRLASTDSYMVLHSEVGHELPLLQEDPASQVIAADPDGRMKNLMTYVLKMAKDEEEGEESELRFWVGKFEDGDSQLTFTDMDRKGLIVDTDTERLCLPVIEGEFVNWRPLAANAKPKPVRTMALNAKLLARLSGLKRASDAFEVTWAGPKEAAVFEVKNADPPLAGLLMPVHTEKAA